tara:strand:- start:2941 stop:3066 length:126 start_codon:yes stop_codon:yes gene_type:complete
MKTFLQCFRDTIDEYLEYPNSQATLRELFEWRLGEYTGESI